MPKTLYSEKDQYQQNIISEFKKNNIYERSAKFYDTDFAMDKNLVLEFLKNTQSKKLTKLNLSDDEIINKINESIIKNGGILKTLKNGVKINNEVFELLYAKEASGFNDDLAAKYEHNKITIMQEVIADSIIKSRVDLVIFVNGFAFACLELKSNFSGQSIKHVIKQYQSRNSNQNIRLFDNKLGAVIFFGLDLQECVMTTKLQGNNTKFLPFNKGKTNDIKNEITIGAGNDHRTDKFSDVWYLWEEILTKDNIINLIKNFIFDDNGTMVFPRYHQFDLVNKIKADILNTPDNIYKNYLIQHSAGSGKTKSIVWLAYMLASLYKNGSVCYEKVIIATDRKVVDKQLQNEISKIHHQDGFIKAIDDSMNSADLKTEIKESNTKIIITTIQKFLYIKDDLKNFAINCAVIIDEAHSSTSGADMEAVLDTLSCDENLSGKNKAKNISLFGFTATPKKETLQIFGQQNANGLYVPFHLYSMQQAIEEKYILNVLANYITYKTYCKLILSDDGKDEIVKENQAIKKLKNLISKNCDVINKRVSIIAEHFANNISSLINNKAKAMVVCYDIESVIKYFDAFCDYCQQHNYNFKPLIAFSGEKVIDGKIYSESSINKISENMLPNEFNKNERRILFVANKYQTGFDQNKLCAMYVIKKLNGVVAVQTLSRLNRICPEDSQKTTVVLDFENEFDDIKNSFAPYYSATQLKDGIEVKNIIALYETINNFNIFIELEESIIANVIAKEENNFQSQLRQYFTKYSAEVNKLENKEQIEFRGLLNKYLQTYLLLKILFGSDFCATNIENQKINNRYLVISHFIKYLDLYFDNDKADISNVIVTNVNVTENQNFINEKPNARTIIKLYNGDYVIPDAVIKKLSEVLQKLNLLFGNNLSANGIENQIDNIIDIITKLLNNHYDMLKTGAKNNNSVNDFFKLCDTEIKNIIIDNYQKYKNENNNNNNIIVDLYKVFLKNDNNERRETFLPILQNFYNYLKY